MNTDTFTRREALLSVIKASVAASAVTPIILHAESGVLPSPPSPQFVPEHDYPFFGPEPDSHKRHACLSSREMSRPCEDS